MFRKDKSWVNKVIFPAPKPPSYNTSTFNSIHKHMRLVWLPRHQAERLRVVPDGEEHVHDVNSVPCLVVPYRGGSDLVLVWCHGNQEDLGNLPRLLLRLSEKMKCHVIGMEYPGYGVSQGTPSESALNNDILVVYSFLRGVLGWPARDILLCGVSIGTGPTTQLASRENVGGLCLVAPYSSIRDMVVDVLPSGVGKMAQYLISNRFVNSEVIRSVKCPTLIVHGRSDKMIPFRHGKLLYDNCGAVKKRLAPADDMDHCFTEDEFDMCVLLPMADFFNRRLSGKPLRRRLNLPDYVFVKPDSPDGDPLPDKNGTGVMPLAQGYV